MKCKVEQCNKKHWAKGFCRNHYELNRRNGKPKYQSSIFKKCKVEKCNNLVTMQSRIGYCKFHSNRKRTGVGLNRPYGIKGENNPRWNGGTFNYPNHSLMKKTRKEVLAEANYLCGFCGGEANQIHHKDLSKDNHSKDNLVACCHKCNHLPEHRNSSITKYKKIYGFSLKELSKITNKSIGYLSRQHNRSEDIFKIKKRAVFLRQNTLTPQKGIWTLMAPDGRKREAKSPLKVVAKEQRDRIPEHIAIKRILKAIHRKS